MAQFLNTGQAVRRTRLGMTIEEAACLTPGLALVLVTQDRLLKAQATIEEVLKGAKAIYGPILWLVVEDGREEYLAGVLSPFELM